MKAADQSASVVTAWMDGSKHSGCCCCGCCNTVYRHMVAPLVSWLVGRPLFLLLRWTISDMDPPCVGALVRSGVRCGRAGCFICNISNKRVLVESRGSLTIHLHTSTAGFISTTRYKAFGFLWICTVWCLIWCFSCCSWWQVSRQAPQLRPQWTWLLMGAGGPITELLSWTISESLQTNAWKISLRGDIFIICKDVFWWNCWLSHTLEKMFIFVIKRCF